MTGKGIPKSEEHKRKISESLKGRPSIMSGRKHSPESIEKMRKSHKGQSNYWWIGRKQTPESNLKNSLAHMGEKHPMYDQHHSEISKLKISAANAGLSIESIIIGPIFKKASKIGDGAHIMIPKSWIGKIIKCIPVDQDIET